MIVKNPRFEKSAAKVNQFPVSDLPEIAFVGRSNVGKSSIVNVLLNRKNIARTGQRPGLTRTINFFNIDEKMFFVDLPGYGFASVSQTDKADWAKVIESYLGSRKQLRAIILLLDIRHSPSKDDMMMYHWIQAFSLPHILVATKSDKISRSQIQSRLSQIKKDLNVKEQIQILPFSATSKYNLQNIWETIDAYAFSQNESNSSNPT